MRRPTHSTIDFVAEVDDGDVLLFRKSFDGDGTVDAVHRLILALDGGTFCHAGVAVREGAALLLCDVTAIGGPIQLADVELDQPGYHQARYRRLDRPASTRRLVAERARQCLADQASIGFAYGYEQLLQAAIAGLATGRPNLPVRARVIRDLLLLAALVAAREAQRAPADRPVGITCAGFVALCHEPVGGLHVSNARWLFGTRSSVYAAAIDDIIGTFGRAPLDLGAALDGALATIVEFRDLLYDGPDSDLDPIALFRLLGGLAGQLEYGEGQLLAELADPADAPAAADDGDGDALPPSVLDPHLNTLDAEHRELSVAAWIFAEVLVRGPAIAAELATVDLTTWLEQLVTDRVDQPFGHRVAALRRLAKLPQVQLMGVSDLEFTPTLSGPSWSYHRFQ